MTFVFMKYDARHTYIPVTIPRTSVRFVVEQQCVTTTGCDCAKAVITIAIRLRHNYDPTTTYRARLLSFDASKKLTRQFFVVVVS